MATSTKPPANAFVARARKVYNPIGFSKGYNFTLWFILIGALFGFALARLEYLDFWGVFCNPDAAAAAGALPGECFYYTKERRYQIGIILHLATVVPGTLLACFQFVPVIRHKLIIVHRINGYIVTLLSFVGTAAAILISRRAAGGGVDVQIFVGVLAIMFLGSLILAIINIKRLQIEQHRAWMIRAWTYGGVIITIRIMLFIAVLVLSSGTFGSYYGTQPCDKIDFALGGQDATLSLYPECTTFYSGEIPDQEALVRATFHGQNVIEVAAAFDIVFGPCGWLALTLHIFLAELYLRLTAAESERLRNVSYQRQLEAGMKNPGMAGLTADRLGDAPKWTPTSQPGRKDSETGNSTKEASETVFATSDRP
ncbi:hypothetical protein F5Y08DRAFT_352454 [Xylaria arbuscula]|nr:hypothetical protein F5Y08DRAFT_352454 [Xylaria arbuscula]